MNKMLAISASLLCAVSGHSIAYAQADQGQAVDEIVVTAQGRQELISDVPIGITSMSSDVIETLGATSTQELEYAAPNLNFGVNDRSSRGEIGIRGVSDYTRSIAVDQRVGVYLDGIFMGRSGAADQDLIGLERVEVLRGPQGTIFGRNSDAGVINMTTKLPSDALEGDMRIEVGKYDLFRLAGYVSGPVADGVAANLAVGYGNKRGPVRNVLLDKDLNGLDRLTLRGAVKADIGDVATLILRADYLTENRDSTNGTPLSGDGAVGKYAVALNTDGFDKRETYGFSGSLDFNLANDFMLSSITAYRDNKAYAMVDEDYSPADILTSNYDEFSDQFSQEVRLISPKTENFDFVAGLYYLKETVSTGRYASFESEADLVGAINNTRITTIGTVKAESFAAYINGNYRFNDIFELTLGARYTREKKSLVYTEIDTTGLFINFDDFKDTRKDSIFSPRGGINLHFADDFMVYANVSRGFKSGGWNADLLTTLEGIRVEPETVTNYEAGAKWTSSDRKLTANLSIFRADYNDYQVFSFLEVPSGQTILSLTNAGKLRSQGVELETRFELIDGFTLTANGAYTDSTFTSFKDGGGSGVDFDGHYAAYAPKISFFLAGDYVAKLENIGKLAFHLDYGHRSRQYSDPDNAPLNRIPAYGLVNGRIGVELNSGFEFAVWAKNILDDDSIRSSSISFLGDQKATFVEPFSFGIQLGYSF